MNEDELQLLQNAYDSGRFKKGKREALRSFLFSCYTSLSYAEFQRVIYSDLKRIVLKEEKYNGIYYLLSNERQKTKEIYKIPIVSPTVISLLEMENKESYLNVFSPLSNCSFNRYLRDVMSELGINKRITFHRARHTFRTIAAKKGHQRRYC